MSRKEQETENSSTTGLEIAVIGMSGRFDGAKNLREFWNNLKNGNESVHYLSDKELEELGVDNRLISDPNYVKTTVRFEDKKYFDASFFGYTPQEAEILHPQTRLLLECCWEALEDAGYDPECYEGLIGLYAGGTSSFHWEALTHIRDQKHKLDNFISRHLCEKDFSCSQVSYNMNLKGACSVVHTACSTSLVAVYLACRALLTGESDMVLAGGTCVYTAPSTGYLYREGFIMSPDGHCRAFDAKTKGTTPGSGVGIVLLKRLKTALADRDHIYAVIKGSAINNDGRRKVSYRAPSVEGQAEAIKAAQRMARVEPHTITYVEAHGTGTLLGDPVEMEGLRLAFNSGRKNTCAIGSVKTNIGHLDTAAGIAGLLKTVLALKHRLIPPTLNFETPNPKLDLNNSPFYINTSLKKWENRKYPLRAGVSSFGAGGTNAHVILEEAPQPGESQKSRYWKLLVLSAKTRSALNKKTSDLAAFLKQNPGINLADAAYTLQVGRRGFEYRKILVCSNPDEAIDALSSPDSRKAKTSRSKNDKQAVVFMFPGLGAQYVNMGLELYREEPVFREEMNRCFEILNGLLDYHIKEILYPLDSASEVSGEDRDINQFEISQLVIFIFEYALAKLLMAWGIAPYAMIGYSFGEYAAACISGVISLEDTLKLVVTRGKLIRETPEGAMLSVPLPVKKIKTFLNNGLSIAIDNGSSTVVSGAADAIADFEKKMKAKKLLCMRLKSRHALHSTLMKPILSELETFMQQVKLNQPQIPYLSNVTGDWLCIEEAANPAYWSAHLLGTVKFAACIKKLVDEPTVIFVEVGPGRDLSTLVKRHFINESPRPAFNLIRTPQEKVPGVYYLLNRIGQLWLHGVKIAWNNFHKEEKRYRISLPTYPFERQLYWNDENPFHKEAEKILEDSLLRKEPDMADWFYVPSWTRSVLVPTAGAPHTPTPPVSCQLVFTNESSLASQLSRQLRQDHPHVITVKKGLSFSKIAQREFTINPRHSHDYDALFSELVLRGQLPRQILHLWCVTGDEKNRGDAGVDFHKLQDTGFYSLLYLAKAIGKQKSIADIRIEVVSDHIQKVTGREILCPGKATVLGPVKVIPQEYPYITCRSIDIEMPEPAGRQEKRLIGQLIEEFAAAPSDTVIAYRDDYRWVQTFQPVSLPQPQGRCIPPLRPGGVYLVTGGLGNIGFALARYLVESIAAKLILTGRTPLPPPEEWEKWLKNREQEQPQQDGAGENLRSKILKLRQLKTMGAEILFFSADVADQEQMQTVVNEAEKRLGPINGIIHAAGRTDAALFQTIDDISPAQCDAHFLPKVAGIRVLEQIFREKDPDFCLAVSSLSPILGGLGFVAYTAANLFLDAFVHQHNRENPRGWLSVNWADWQFEKAADTGSALGASAVEMSITPEQGISTFQRILNNYHLQQLIVSAGNLQARIDRWIKLKSLRREDNFIEDQSAPVISRPELLTPYVAPRNKLEKNLVDIWQKFFGLDRVGIRDNFFELGGDSLKAITAISRIHKKLNAVIPLVEFLNRSTIENLAVYIRGEEKEIQPMGDENVVLLKKGSHRANHFFFIHDGTGDVDVYTELCNRLHSGFNYWGILADRLENVAPGHFVIEPEARKYIEKIKNIQPDGPYYLGGWSFGGIVAFEMVRQLERIKDPVRFFSVIDPVSPFRDTLDTFTPITLESELAGLDFFPSDMAEEIRKKVRHKKISGIRQFWSMIVEYLSDPHIDVEAIKRGIPANMAVAIPNFHSLEIGRLIYYVNAIRSFTHSLSFYKPGPGIQTRIHYFGASQSKGTVDFNKKSWDEYCLEPICFFEIPGDHFTILKLPGVVYLAEEFNRQLPAPIST